MPAFTFRSFRVRALPLPDSKDILVILKNDIQAYRICQAEEQRLMIGLGNTDKDEDVICVRILGWLMLLAADGNGDEKLLRATASAIISCPQTLVEVGKFLIQHWIGIYRKHKNRRVFDYLADESSYNPPVDPIVERTRDISLGRDGFRCVLTKVFDKRTTFDKKVWIILNVLCEIYDAGTTKCALICASSPTWTLELSNQNPSAEVLAAVAILECLFSYLSPKELDGENLYKLENVITLEFNFYDDFENLQLWFDPVDMKDHTYEIGMSRPKLYAKRKFPKEIELKNYSYDDWLQLPSKHYLAAHALCAKVANLSGAVLYLEDLEQLEEEDEDEDEAGDRVEVEDTEVAEGDGSAFAEESAIHATLPRSPKSSTPLHERVYNSPSSTANVFDV